jgi:hypothetical protein
VRGIQSQAEAGIEAIDPEELPSARNLSTQERLFALDLFSRSILFDSDIQFTVSDDKIPDPPSALSRHCEARRRLFDVLLSDMDHKSILLEAVLDPKTFRSGVDPSEEQHRRLTIIESNNAVELRELLISSMLTPWLYKFLISQEISNSPMPHKKQELYRSAIENYQATRREVVGECYTAILVMCIPGLQILQRVEVLEAAIFNFCSALDRFDKTLPYTMSAYSKWWVRQGIFNAVLTMICGTPHNGSLVDEQSNGEGIRALLQKALRNGEQESALCTRDKSLAGYMPIDGKLNSFAVSCQLITPELVGDAPMPNRGHSLLSSGTNLCWCL